MKFTKCYGKQLLEHDIQAIATTIPIKWYNEFPVDLVPLMMH